MVVVVALAELRRAQEPLGPVVTVPMASSSSPTHRLVGHQNGSPTLIPNIQLQYPPMSKSRPLPSPLALRSFRSTHHRSIANQLVGTNPLAFQYQLPKFSLALASFHSTLLK